MTYRDNAKPERVQSAAERERVWCDTFDAERAKGAGFMDAAERADAAIKRPVIEERER